jgi:hypothetical protein
MDRKAHFFDMDDRKAAKRPLRKRSPAGAGDGHLAHGVRVQNETSAAS